MGTIPRLRGTPAQNLQVRTAWIIEATRRVEPDLSDELLRRAIELAAPRRARRAVLASELLTRPEVLTCGLSDSSPVTQAYLEQLVAAGARRVVLATCELCGRGPTHGVRLPSGGRACNRCTRRMRVQACSVCGQVGPRGSRGLQGEPVCERCTDRARVSYCDGCGKRRRGHRRLPGGRLLCSGCSRNDPSTWEACARCGRVAPVAARHKSGPVCSRCYDRPQYPCDRCGQVSKVHSRRTGEAVCSRCYHAPQQLCAACGHPRPHQREVVDRCPRCESVQSRTCDRCGDTVFGFGVNAAGEHQCERCWLRVRLIRLLGDHNGIIDPRLATFVDALGSVESPRNAMQWLTRGRANNVLGAMARGDQGLDHATLDRAAGQRRGRALAIEHLRQLLVVSGALPPRDEYMSRLERTIEARLSAAHPRDARVLRSYATWHVLSGARRRVARGRPSQGISRGALAAMTVAETFLAWLRESGLDREAVPQAAVDHWLTQHPGRAVHLATFLRWAQRRGLPSKVHIDSQLRWFPTTFMHADTQWALVQRLLHDDTVAPGDRLVACLVMLYGQPLRRVARLRHSDISTTGPQTMVKLGSEAVVLIGPLDEIAGQMLHGQARDRRVQGLAKSFPNQQDWLFPGRVAGQPIGVKALQGRMKKLGIQARGARNTAVLNLARDVPASVLADLLGITAATAERWRELAGGNWTTYAPIGGYRKSPR